MNAAFAILQPTLPYPDLLQTWMAEHLAIAEQIQTAHMTLAQGNAVITQKWSDMVAEEQRRQLANRSIAAQEEAAAVRAQWETTDRSVTALALSPAAINLKQCRDLSAARALVLDVAYLAP